MRLADDDRARVPFALLGVLLLVGASTYAVTLSTRGPVRDDRTVGTAMDRAEAAAVGALRTAAADAARDAARAPVTAPADTPTGGVLNDSQPFRDALRLRIYVAARRGFESAAYRHRGVTARASLPVTPNASSLRRAKERVRVAPADDGAALRVTLRNVTLSAQRDGRTVAREGLTINLTVATPVLGLHDRTRAFERRLNRAPLDGAGLGLRLTGRLYPVAWARGYAQYGGAPVANVLANRHVALSANGGVLGVQRAVFGRSDPDGRASLRRATLRTGVTDLLGPASADAAAVAETALPRPNRPGDVRDGRTNWTLPRLGSSGAPGPDRRIRVGTAVAADRAFSRLLAGAGGASLDGVLREAYRANLSVRTAVRTASSGDVTGPDAPPGGGWTLVHESSSSDTSVERGDAPTPDAAEGERVFASFGRVVTVERTVTRAWRRENETHRVVGARLNATLGGVPAGLPVTPVPGYWYATVNVWTVTVRGEYARFSVRSNYAGGRTGGELAYVRDGGTATLDVDGDGAAERLGRGERVRFETGTVVAVAVPPTGRGVGDVNGDADERSAGWPCPGFTLRDRSTTNACAYGGNGK